MKLLGIDYIVFEDSYLLGWNISNDRIDLYCELLLTEKHPEFEPFDKKKIYGCYKTGRVEISDFMQHEGLPSLQCPISWNKNVNEIKDITEINGLLIDSDKRLIVLQTDDFELKVVGESIRLIVFIEMIC